VKTIVQDVTQACKKVITPTPHTHTGSFTFDAGLPVFKGHFPGHPIVPGIYLLECASRTFQRGEGKGMRVVQVKQAKFMAPVHPPCEIRVSVSGEFTGELWKVDCEIYQSETVAMTALLEIAEMEDTVA